MSRLKSNTTTTESKYIWELDEAEGRENINRPKKSTWTEHVWSTFFHRGYNDDVTDNDRTCSQIYSWIFLIPCSGSEHIPCHIC